VSDRVKSTLYLHVYLGVSPHLLLKAQVHHAISLVQSQVPDTHTGRRAGRHRERSATEANMHE